MIICRGTNDTDGRTNGQLFTSLFRDKLSLQGARIKMMKDQEEMLVMAYGRDTYKSMVLGLMNGLPGLKKQQLPQEDKTGGDSDDE